VEDIWREIAGCLRPVFQKYKIQRAILFGSSARGDRCRRSDIDLIVIQETTKRFLDRYEGILADVYLALPGYEIDLLIYTPEEMQFMAERPFIQRALSEGVVVYESSKETTPG